MTESFCFEFICFVKELAWACIHNDMTHTAMMKCAQSTLCFNTLYQPQQQQQQHYMICQRMSNVTLSARAIAKGLV